jgi:arsenate reductase
LPDAEFVDVRLQGVPSDVLLRALEQFGDALVNTRSTTWRGLDAAERARPAEELLRAYPTLMKRPLTQSGDDLFLGWSKDVEQTLAAT